MHCRDFDHTVVIIHTHSDDSSGDLWFTSNDEELRGPAAMPISDVGIPLPTLDDSKYFFSSLIQLLAMQWWSISRK